MLTREQRDGMRNLGLTDEQIRLVGRIETDEERDARLEREAIAEEAPAPVPVVTPLERQLAEQNAELRHLVEQLRAQVVEATREERRPPPPTPEPEKPFLLPGQQEGETEEHWLQRIGESVIEEARTERRGETGTDRAERLVNLIRRSATPDEAEQLMDLVADVLALEGGMSVRDVWTLLKSP